MTGNPRLACPQNAVNYTANIFNSSRNFLVTPVLNRIHQGCMARLSSDKPGQKGGGESTWIAPFFRDTPTVEMIIQTKGRLAITLNRTEFDPRAVHLREL